MVMALVSDETAPPALLVTLQPDAPFETTIDDLATGTYYWGSGEASSRDEPASGCQWYAIIYIADR